MRKLFKIILITIILATAASWVTSVAYGHDNAGAQLSGSTQQGIEITVAPVAAAPAATFYGGAIGSVTPGDLFYINAADAPQDITVNLYLTNVDQLVHNLRYLNLKVVVYYEVSPGQWEKAVLADGSAFPEVLLTMKNGVVSFNLRGMANYKVGIASGCFDSHPFSAANENASPSFYLEAESL